MPQIISVEQWKVSEHLLPNFFPDFFVGCRINNKACRLVKNNSVDIYAIDWKIEIDGTAAAWIDSELKPKWKNGDWPYPYLNVAVYTKSYNDGGQYRTETNKVKWYRKHPRTSFFMAIRSDGQKAALARASIILACKIESIYADVGRGGMDVFRVKASDFVEIDAMKNDAQEFIANCLEQEGIV